MLATRYLDAKMYGEALKTFQTAIQYYPANQNLFYYVGVCAGYMAKASLDFNASGGTSAEKFNYLKLAESAYLRAIELEPRYVRSLYGLGVLYVFELDQCEKAIPYLETAPSVETLLHAIFPQKYVLHLHPALVNGLTCSRVGGIVGANKYD